jgi:hypothetical protein
MEATAVKKVTELQPLQVNVKGKVLRVRRWEGHIYTAMVCPAKDEYSKPQTVEVRSEMGKRIGDVGDIVTVVAELRGFERKPYRTKPDRDGVVATVIPVELVLDLASGSAEY